jgi:hypothetical protein
VAQRVFKTRTVVQPTARSVRLRRRSVTRIARISRGFDRLGLAVFVPILGTAFSPEPSFETLRLVLEAGAGQRAPERNERRMSIAFTRGDRDQLDEIRHGLGLRNLSDAVRVAVQAYHGLSKRSGLLGEMTEGLERREGRTSGGDRSRLRG